MSGNFYKGDTLAQSGELSEPEISSLQLPYSRPFRNLGAAAAPKEAVQWQSWKPKESGSRV